MLRAEDMLVHQNSMDVSEAPVGQLTICSAACRVPGCVTLEQTASSRHPDCQEELLMELCAPGTGAPF